MLERESKEKLLHELSSAILKLHPDGLTQLIEFLETDGAINDITDVDVRNIALMREGFDFKDKYFFGGPKAMGNHIATVLRIAKSSELGVEGVLSELVDTQNTLNKMAGGDDGSEDQ